MKEEEEGGGRVEEEGCADEEKGEGEEETSVAFFSSLFTIKRDKGESLISEGEGEKKRETEVTHREREEERKMLCERGDNLFLLSKCERTKIMNKVANLHVVLKDERGDQKMARKLALITSDWVERKIVRGKKEEERKREVGRE